MKPLNPPVDDLILTCEVAGRPLPTRPAPKKLALRVSGSRLGSVARPMPDGLAGGVAAGAVPTHRLGLRVHSSTEARPVGVPVPAPVRVLTRDDYASAEDYE